MKKIARIALIGGMLLSMGLSVVATAQEMETIETQVMEARLGDTPSKWGFKGLYTLFSPDTAQKGKFGMGLYWDMTRFVIPGDPRYPEVMEITLGGYYGITDRLEVGVAVPFRSLKIPERESRILSGDGTGLADRTRFSDDPAFDEVSESGISNVSVGLRFNAVRGDSFMVTPYVQAFLPTGSDPEMGIGADNTRIHFGVSAGTVVGDARPVRLYSQVAYQFATDYDQDRRDFTETPPYVTPENRPRFDYFGTNPLFQEYGNTLFYGAGFAVPILTDDRMDLFTELQLYHSLDDEDYIPMFEDGEPLDVVQDGGIARVGTKIGFGNGFALTAGWGGILFAEEPMYESPHWQAFAGLTYNKPEVIRSGVDVWVPGQPLPNADLKESREIYEPDIDITPPPVVVTDKFDCEKALKELETVHFEFDKATLTPQAIETLRRVAAILRVCTPCDESLARITGVNAMAQNCELTDRSIAQLRNQNVPESVISGLQSLRSVRFATQRHFLDAVEARIGTSAMRQYRDLIVQYACSGCDYMLEVQGHTDWIGTENYNMKLGARRARAIVYYLVYDEGIAPSRIVDPNKLARGIIAGETYGESRPLQSNETDSGRAINRRGQFITLAY